MASRGGVPGHVLLGPEKVERQGLSKGLRRGRQEELLARPQGDGGSGEYGLPASQPASHPIQAGGEKFDAKGSHPSFSHPLFSISSLDLASFDTLPQTALHPGLLMRPCLASLSLSPSALASPALSFLQLHSLLFCPSSCLFLQLWQLLVPPSSAVLGEREPSEEQK